MNVRRRQRIPTFGSENVCLCRQAEKGVGDGGLSASEPLKLLFRFSK